MAGAERDDKGPSDGEVVGDPVGLETDHSFPSQMEGTMQLAARGQDAPDLPIEAAGFDLKFAFGESLSSKTGTPGPRNPWE